MAKHAWIDWSEYYHGVLVSDVAVENYEHYMRVKPCPEWNCDKDGNASGEDYCSPCRTCKGNKFVIDNERNNSNV